MIAQIPTLTDGTQHYEHRVRLDGSDYYLTFTWQLRREVWTLDVATVARADALRSQVVTLGVPLLARAVGGPPGEIFALSASVDSTAAAPGLHELGGRVRLWYFSEEEFS